MAPAQQALAEGEMAIFETYETEYELLRRPVFRWDSEVEPKAVDPGRKTVLTIICSGKVGWCVINHSAFGTLSYYITYSTSGSIQISYSHILQEELTPSDVFYTRQVLYPVLVTVYNTLECHGMDILPFAFVTAALESGDGAATTEREGWKQTLEGVGDEDGEWCLFTVDVRNTYGIPFEVTFERNQEG